MIHLLALALCFLATAAAAPSRGAASVLVCEGSGCEADRALLAARGMASDLVAVDLLVELDAQGAARTTGGPRFAAALAQARTAVAAGKWAAARAALAEADSTLATWPGTVAPDDLFAVYLLHAAVETARPAGEGPTAHAHLAQAAAVLDGGRPAAWPAVDSALRQAWLDALRQLETSGRGELVLPPLEAGARWFVDGRPAQPGRHSLLSGEHRITAVAADAAATWRASVPVLPGRTSVVRPALEPAHHAAWVLAQLRQAFDTHSAPEPVITRLSDWCARQGLVQLRLLMVVDPAAEAAADVTVGPPDPMRPPAAAGPPRDYGEGVPLTWEQHVDQAATEAQDAPGRAAAPRVRAVVFDASTGRFLAAGLSPVDPATVPGDTTDRLSADLRLGFVQLLGQSHAALELGAAWSWEAVAAELRLGLLRAPEAYALTPTWEDRQLYTVYGGARWTGRPTERWGPELGGGVEVLVPVTVGLRAQAGVVVRPGGGWRVGVEGQGRWGLRGPGAGVVVGVGWQG